VTGHDEREHSVEYIIFAAGAVIFGLFCFWALFDGAKDAQSRRAHPERASIVDTELFAVEAAHHPVEATPHSVEASHL
jgi:hypothetical protein